MTNSTIQILQWDCRNLRRKKNDLQQYLLSLPRKPGILLIQEPLAEINLTVYITFTQPSISAKHNTPLVATYIDKSLPTIQIDCSHLNNSDQEHVVTIMQPPHASARPLLIINAYWRPGKNLAT